MYIYIYINMHTHIYVHIYMHNRATGLMSTVFVDGPGDRGSILGQVIPKAQKWYLMTPCLALGTIR